MQLDIFEHNRDVMLRNDVALALEQRDAAAAQQSWAVLAAEYPHDALLAPLAALQTALLPAAHDAGNDGPALTAARDHMLAVVEPAAMQVFGAAAAQPWLRPLWRALAQRAQRQAFSAARDDDANAVHAAPLWLRAADFAAAAQAVGTIESWRRVPLALAWMAEARWRLHDEEAAFALLCELAWLAPPRFDRVERALADPMLGKLRKRFDAGFEGAADGTELAWFPAWCLTEQPALAHWLAPAEMTRDTAPERAARLLLELLRLERQGRQREIIERRRSLRTLHAGLYAAYMATR